MDIKAPTFPESIADGSVAEWHYQVGDFVAKDDLLVDIETDKVVIEVYAPTDGTLSSILKGEGETVLSEEVIAQFSEGAAEATQSQQPLQTQAAVERQSRRRPVRQSCGEKAGGRE